VLDSYTNSNLVYYEHNGDDEPYGESYVFGISYEPVYDPLQHRPLGISVVWKRVNSLGA